jgi:DNA-directed RNA polymerase subunit RPC12/RpoP
MPNHSLKEFLNLKNYTMPLKCPQCSSLNTEVVPADSLSNASGVPPGGLGITGSISPSQVIDLVSALAKAIVAVIDYFSDKKRKYLVCKNCGYYHKV